MPLVVIAAASDATGQDRPNWLNQVEWEFLRGQKVIRIAPDPDFPPIEEIDAQGNYRGIGADYVRLIESKLGVRFTVVNLKTWDAVLAAARARQVDMLPAAANTPQRQAYLLFSSPHLILPGAIIVRNDVRGDLTLAQLGGKRIAIVSGYVWQELIRSGYPDVEMILLPNLTAALKAVSQGEVDAAVEALPVVIDVIKKEGLGNLRVAGETGFFTRLSFATRSDWPMLSSVLEKTLAQITPGERQTIYSKWIGLETQPHSGFPWQTLWRSIAGIALLAALLTLIAAAWIRSLRRQVRIRTETLDRQAIRLRESEERLRDFIEATSDWLWEMDENLILTYLSPNFTTVTGIDAAELVGKDRNDLITATLGDVSIEEHRARENQRLPYRDFQFELTLAHHPPLFISSSGKPVFDRAGRFLGYRGTSNDISERRRMQAAIATAEARAYQAQKMEAIGQMTGGIAHDFNNLLQVILGNADFLESAHPPGSAGFCSAQQIRLAGERAARLTKHLLAFARRQPLQPEPVRLDEAVESLRPLLQRVLGETIDMRYEIPVVPILAMADRAQVESALVNLALNSRDAMPNGGTFTVAIDTVEADAADADLPDPATGRFARLRVSDTGAGMPPDVLKKAFEPFFTTKEFGKGSGLGLSMVFGFAKQSGGHAELESAPNRGTTVTILLPLVDAPAQVEAAPAPADAPSATGPAVVLVVEDDALVRAQVATSIRSLGYQVIDVGDGPAALRHVAEAGAVDLLFTDIVMPGGMNGRELAAQARTLRPELRVLFTSGYADNVLAGEGGLDEGLQFLGKPYRRADLARALGAALSARNSADEPHPPIASTI